MRAERKSLPSHGNPHIISCGPPGDWVGDGSGEAGFAAGAGSHVVAERDVAVARCETCWLRSGRPGDAAEREARCVPEGARDGNSRCRDCLGMGAAHWVVPDAARRGVAAHRVGLSEKAGWDALARYRE